MNAVPRTPMTVAEFLDWEERQELRYEFDGVQVLAMTGGTFEHDAIQMALARALGNRLEGKPCRAHGSNRMGDDWVGHILTAESVIHMPEIGIELPLAELYTGLDLANPPEDEAD